MALRVAVANGNWSSTATWNGGVLPAAGDVVASNGFTVTIDQNVNVDSITNAATTVPTEIPTMTSNTAPSGIASNTGTANFTNYGDAFRAFDQTGSLFYAGTPAITDWVAYEFTSPKKIGQFAVSFNGAYSANFSLEAWDGSTWILIGTHNTTGGNTSPVFANTTAYIKYRLRFATVTSYTQVTEVYMYDALSVAAVAGGTFNLNSGVTVTCTSANYLGNTNLTLLTYNGSGTSTFYANLRAGTVNPALLFSGTGTLNLIGNIAVTNNSDSLPTVTHSNTGTLNFTGNISANSRSASSGIVINGTGILNITGNLSSGTGDVASAPLRINGVATVSITGNVLWETNAPNFAYGPLVAINSAATFNMVGSVIGGRNTSIGSGSAGYIKIIGPIYYNPNLTASVAAFSSTSSGAFNILSGPFSSSLTGIQPLWVTRMHYFRTVGSYFEFRDNSTNGALPPLPNAPATRLVVPGTAVDSPLPANVRQGITYASSSLTGTMVVPAASNVASGVLVDNTVGTAVLDSSSIWAVPLTSINTLNSIGRRVKNAATVETTGAQIQTTINNNI